MSRNLGNCLLLISILLVGVSVTHGFESWELDLFDVVEDVNANFYEAFDVKPDFTSSELRKKYKKLSLQWHPDRNQEEGAEKKFRNIVSMYDILKDPKLRKKYDEVLEFGLPDWRSPSFYFRRARKFSTLELSISISLILTIGHYFVLWAHHFEQKLTLEDKMGEVKKKLEKKQKKKNYKGSELEDVDNELQSYYDSMKKPSLKDILPYRLFWWSLGVLGGLPKFVMARLKKSSDADQEEGSVEEQSETQNGKRWKKRDNTEHLKLNPEIISKSNIKAPITNNTTETEEDSKGSDNAQNMKREWTDLDKNELIKTINKFPAGTTNRWNKIAEIINRTAADCINMDRQIRANFNNSKHLNSTTWTDTNSVLNRKETPMPTVKLDENSNIETKKDTWTQEQQLKFEQALKSVSKDASNRWEKISEQVPEKSKEDCINRFKTICADLKKKQEQKA